MKKTACHRPRALAAAVAGIVLCGCRGSAPLPDEVLVSTPDSALTVSRVVARIPVGMDPGDSLELFNRIVSDWIESRVLSDLAREKLPSTDEIDRRTEAFRNRLIVADYLQRMSNGRNFQADSDSIRAFYNERRREMMSEVPIVKGLFLKVPSGSPALADIRRCVFEATPQSLDELEKKWMGQTLQCDWFLTEWVDWEVLADEIPHRFGNPDAFLEANGNFETEVRGIVYLLHISEWLPSGSELPFEFAAPRIAAMYERANLTSYQRQLVKALVRQALADGRLTAGNYDPVNGRRLRTVKKNNDNKLNDDK